MFTILLVFHVIVCICLILVVLMQASKGEGLAGSAFGGGALSGAVFGGRGAASFLSRATTVLAILFMLNSGALAFMQSGGRSAPAGTAPDVTESAVTRQAQREMEEAMRRQEQQQQQQQQQMPGDSAPPIQIMPMDQAPGQQPTSDTAGN